MVTRLALLLPPAFLILSVNIVNSRSAAVPIAPYAVGLGGLIAVGLLASNWLSLSELRVAISLAVLVGLGLAGLTLLTRLDYADFERGGPALLGESSRPELRKVEAMARDWWRQAPDLPIKVDSSLRRLEWSLRDGPRVEWISSAPLLPDRTILGAATTPDRPLGRWVRLVIVEKYVPANGAGPLSLWRWFATRQPLVRSEPHGIIFTE